MEYYTENEPKGECVIVIEGKSFSQIESDSQEEWKKLSVDEHMKHYLEQGMDKKEAMKAVARDRGVSKQDIYKQLL